MRPIGQLEGGRKIVLAVSVGQQGEIPPFVLYEAGERHAGINFPLRAQENITKSAALGELRIGHHCPIPKLDGLVGSKPIAGFSTERNSLPAYRAVTHDDALVGVTIFIAGVPVEKSSTRRLDQT